MTTIENRGPKIAEADVVRFEASLGSPLPAEYREFLLMSNGGVPTPDTIDIPEFSESPTDVQVLFGVGRSVESSRLEWNLTTLADRLGADLLPIACDSGGNTFCLSLRPDDIGAVLYCDLQAVFAESESSPECYYVAPSFESFLERLRPFS